MNIQISTILNANSAVSPQAGEPIFHQISQAIEKNDIVDLDFSGMEFMTTAFLNSAIGQLYSIYSPEKISSHMRVKNISNSNAVSLKKVIDTAKIYFKHIKDFND